jgi:peptidoglycan/xylan/chitin deacetylase (PgdA/CDA1 family)
MRTGLTILVYHRVLPASEALQYPLSSLAMSDAAFKAQMAWLAEHAEVCTVDRAIDQLSRGEIGSRPLVAVTFDDGYEDNAETAAPIMESLGIRGTFYIATSFVEKQTPLWYDKVSAIWIQAEFPEQQQLCVEAGRERGCDLHRLLEHLKRRPDEERAACVERWERRNPGAFDGGSFRAMTREQVAGLSARGHEIGAHTVTHPILPQTPTARVAAELVESRAWLGSATGKEIRGFSYPNGDHDQRVRDEARKAGFRYAVSMTPGLNMKGCDLLQLQRVDVNPRRVLGPDYRHDQVAFRAEVARMRVKWSCCMKLWHLDRGS